MNEIPLWKKFAYLLLTFWIVIFRKTWFAKLRISMSTFCFDGLSYKYFKMGFFSIYLRRALRGWAHRRLLSRIPLALSVFARLLPLIHFMLERNGAACVTHDLGVFHDSHLFSFFATRWWQHSWVVSPRNSSLRIVGTPVVKMSLRIFLEVGEESVKKSALKTSEKIGLRILNIPSARNSGITRILFKIRMQIFISD